MASKRKRRKVDSSRKADGNLGWVDSLANLGQKTKEPEGDGWLTIWQIIDESPYGITKTRNLVRNCVADGTWEFFEGNVLSGELLVRARWYRPKSPK